VHPAEDLEIEERLGGGRDARCGVGLTFLDGDDAMQDGFFDFLRGGTGAVGVESPERRRSEHGGDARRHRERVIDRVCRHVGARAGRDLGIGVAPVGERLDDPDARFGVSVLVETTPWL